MIEPDVVEKEAVLQCDECGYETYTDFHPDLKGEDKESRNSKAGSEPCAAAA